MPTYWRADNTVHTDVEDTLVVLAPATAEFFALNPVAARVWELVADGPVSDDDLVSRLLDEFEVEPERCRASVAEFLTNAVAAGIVVRAG